MLSVKNRLVKKTDIDKVFKNGKSIRSDFLILKTLKSNLDESRFAFVVSKKISSKAVVRNKIRRRLRKIVGELILQIKKPVDGIFITLPGIEKESFEKLEITIKNTLK